MKSSGVAALAFAAVSGDAWAQGAPPPAAAFGAPPAVIDLAISPGGKHVAVVRPVEDQLVVSIATIDRPDLPQLSLGDVDLSDLRWLGEDYVLATVAFWFEMKKPGEYEVKPTRLRRTVAIGLDGKLASTLLEQDKAAQMLVAQDVVGVTSGPSPRALMIGRAPAPPGLFGVSLLWRVDPATGKGELAETGQSATATWGFDIAGEARTRWDALRDGDFSILSRPKSGGDWKEVWRSHGLEERKTYHGYSAPDDAIMLTRKGPAGYELVLKAAGGGAERVVGHPHATPPSFAWDKYGLTAAALFEETDRPHYDWLEPGPGAVHAALSKAFKDCWVELYGWSRDGQRYLVGVNSPDIPTRWMLYDHQTHQVSPLAEEYPQLAGAALGVTHWVTYLARDGRELGAYVTLPPGGGAGRDSPVVVLAHDGPARRNHFSFDYMVQFLATRGYVVVQPQYRGSAGFGPELESAGEGQWAGAMQTDLLDAVQAVTATGQGDGSRACVVGAGFGGYLALGGMAFQSGAYRCAVSIGGISDLSELVSDPGRTYAGRAVKQWLAAQKLHPLDRLSDMSPARAAAAVKGPILLVVPAKDMITPPKQSELMRDALRRSGRPVEFLAIDKADTDFTSAATRTQMLGALEAFLAKNLPVKPAG